MNYSHTSHPIVLCGWGVTGDHSATPLSRNLVLITKVLDEDLGNSDNHCENYFPGHICQFNYLRTILWFLGAKVIHSFNMNNYFQLNCGNKDEIFVTHSADNTVPFLLYSIEDSLVTSLFLLRRGLSRNSKSLSVILCLESLQ